MVVLVHAGLKPVGLARRLESLALVLFLRCRQATNFSQAVCGNSLLASTETCDDGNLRDGDGTRIHLQMLTSLGCSSSCQEERGWDCPSPGLPCKSTQDRNKVT